MTTLGRLPPSIVAGGLLPVDVTNAQTLSVEGPQSVPSRMSVVLVDGTMAGDIPGGPVGPCGTLSPLFHEVLGPLEHSVLDYAGPAGQHVAVGRVGPLRTLFS